MQRGARPKATSGLTSRFRKLAKAVDRALSKQSARGRGTYRRNVIEALEERRLLANGVIINEFLSSNSNRGFQDPAFPGQFPDWIELHNPTGAAVDLTGWKLRDGANTWTFPTGSNINANGYLLVAADGKNSTSPVAVMHTNFSLSNNGEYLGLLRPDDTVASEFAPQYPGQSDDISYGFVQTAITTPLVGPTQTFKALVPGNGSVDATWREAAFDEVGWVEGSGGVGFDTDATPPPAPAGWTVRMVDTSTGVISNIGQAIDILNGFTSGYTVASNTTTTYTDIDFLDAGRLPANRALPNGAGTSTPINAAQRQHYAVRATSRVFIPQGTYTVGINSDDGFQLTIPGVRFTNRIGENYSIGAGAIQIASGSNQLTYAGVRSGETYGTFTVGPGGLTTDVQLDMFNGTGGNHLEFFVSSGTKSGYDATFVPVANGALGWQVRQTGPDPSYQGKFGLDLQNQPTPMKGNSATAYMRIPFNVRAEDLPAFQSLVLRMRYDDGFVAWINGQQVASANAPGALDWQSAATGTRPDAQAVVDRDFSIAITPGLLVAGTNYLYVQALNVSAADSDFLAVPTLDAVTGTTDVQRFFGNPTPGAANSTSFIGQVADTKFSHNRGFYDAPFDLVITSNTGSATIRYTTDGTAPSEINGTVYTGPITINKTTTIRAAAFRNGYLPTNLDTQTYIFPADVATQSASNSNNGTPPPGWPASWSYPNGPGQITDYGMDPDVLNAKPTGPAGSGPTFGATIKNDLKTIPTLSITTDLNNLFGPNGIYSNPGQDGIDWERPMSLELINPDGSDGFQLDAGLRIRGGFSRDPNNPKHGLRVIMRNEYGANELDYPLFADQDGVDKPKSFDLRTFQNYSWSFNPDGRGLPEGARFTGIRDQWSRDTQHDMGHNSERGNYYNLYINGMYWGIYNTVERPEAEYGSTYYGGEPEDYDVIKVEAGPYTINATDGTLAGWTDFWTQSNALRTAATNGQDTTALYQKLMGNNPDGTRNPAYPVYLDPVNLIDYMLVIYYGGNLDAPISNFLSNASPNNFYALWNRKTKATGFQFFAHDGEHTLLNPTGGDEADRLGPWQAGSTLDKSNPQWIFQQLLYNGDFRTLVADRIHKHFFNDGELTVQQNQQRFLNRVKEMNRAVVAESARWGDSKSAAPYLYSAPYSNSNPTVQNWQNNVNTVLYNFFPQRNPFIMNTFRTHQMGTQAASGPNPAVPIFLYPSFDAPEFTQGLNAVIPANGVVNLTNPSGVGTIYYTTDGTDPRLPGGGLSGSAVAYNAADGVALTGTTRVLARIRNGNSWSALTDSTFRSATPPTLRVTEIMYHAENPPAGSAFSDNDFEYIEVQNVGATSLNVSKFAFTNGVKFTFPNVVLAAGGRAVIVANTDAFRSKYGESIMVLGEYTGSLDNSGEGIKLVGKLGETVQSFDYKDSWQPHTDGDGFSLVVRDPNQPLAAWDDSSGWRASNAAGGDPGADVASAIAPDAVVVNEIAAKVATPNTTWIELRNTTNAPVDISGWFLSNGTGGIKKYRFPAGTVIPANGFLVLNEQTSYGQVGNPNALIPFTLDGDGGDEVVLAQADGAGTLLGYRQYTDYVGADVGQTVGRHVKGQGDVDHAVQKSATPGAENAGPTVGPLIINEVMYGPIQKFGLGANLTSFPNPNMEFVELRNTTGTALNVGGWRVTGGIEYTFAAGLTVPAYGFIVLTNLAPSDFRLLYPTLPAAAVVVGPVTGFLNNTGEKLRIERPTGPAVNGVTPYTVVDRLNYDNKGAWPTAPDETAGSLIRRNPLVYGNDVTNWQASSQATGSPGVVNLPSVAPTVDAGADVVVTEGATWTQQGSFTDPDLGETYSVVVLWGDGTPNSQYTVTPERTFTMSHVFPDNGPYQVQVRVVDSTSRTGTDFLAVSVGNAPPTGTLGVQGNPTATVAEGGSAIVSFTNVTDPGTRDVPPTGAFKYSFDFDNDGTYDVVDSTQSSAAIPAALLGDGPAVVTVKGRVTDKDGGFTEYTTAVTVTGVAPTVAPIANATVPAGGAYAGSGSFTDPGANDGPFTGTVDWDYHAGDTDSVPLTINPDQTFALNRTFAATGTYVVRVRVTDADGAVGFTDFNVTVGGGDVIPPTVTSGQFLYKSGPRKVAVTFSEDVSASLTPDDLVILNRHTNAEVQGQTTMTWDAATNTATWSFPAGVLPAHGDYRVTVKAAGIKDAALNAMAADAEFAFFFVNGDANHDRTVDFNDLVAMAQNYDTVVGASPTAFEQGDFTGDGAVDFNDLVILAQRYETTLGPPPAPGGVAAGPVPVAGATMTFAQAWAKATGSAAPTVPPPAPVKPAKPAAPKPAPKPVVAAKPKPAAVKVATPAPAAKRAVAASAPVAPSVFSVKKIAGSSRKVSDVLA
jgi:hypothetical protein